MQDRVKALKKEHGSKVLGQVTVDQAIGGMRGIPVGSGSVLFISHWVVGCMLWRR